MKITKYLPFFLLLLALISCQKLSLDDLPECLSQFGEFKPINKPMVGDANFVFYESAALLVTEEDDNINFDLVDGDRTVFRYEFSKNDNPEIADDEYGEAIWFEVEPNADTFQLSDDDLVEAHALFGRFCFCVDGGFHKLERGCIYGEKISDSEWRVAIAVRTHTTWEAYTRMIYTDFKKTDKKLQAR